MPAQEGEIEKPVEAVNSDGEEPIVESKQEEEQVDEIIVQEGELENPVEVEEP